MFRSTTWLTVFSVGLLALLLLGGGFSPFGLGAMLATTWTSAKLGMWVVSSLLALFAGPLLLAWVFVKGPPDRRDGSMAGTVLLSLAGLALCVTALFKLPFLAAAFAMLFLGW